MSNKKNISIVVGMHRSGTSVLTRMLNILGADPGGNLMRPAEDNPTGFWEPIEIVDVHDELLRYLGYSWSDPRPFPYRWWERPDLDGFRSRLYDLAVKQYADVDRPIFKDPRLCRLLPFWQKIFEELQWGQHYIHIVRSPLDVASSLAKREGYSANHGYLLWLRYVTEAEKWTRYNTRAFLIFDNLFDDWKTEIRRCQSQLGQETPAFSNGLVAEVSSFLESGLRHNHAEKDELFNSPYLSSLVKDSYRFFQQMSLGSMGEKEFQGAFDLIRQQLEATDNLYSSIWQPCLKERDAANHQLGICKEQVNSMSADLAHNRKLALVYEKQNKELIDKIQIVADNSGKNEVLVHELERRINEYSANDKDLRSQVGALQSENSKLKMDLVEKDAVLRVETENARLQQPKYEVSRQELLGQIESKSEEINKVSNMLAEAESVQRELRGICEADNALIKTLRDELQAHADDLNKYRDWMNELTICIKALFLSKRWRAGELAGMLSNIFMLRRNPKTAKGRMLEILQQYDAAVDSETHDSDLRLQVLEADAPDHWGTLSRLVAVALKNPTQTMRLLSVRRLTSFLETIFRNDPYRSEWIYDNYLRLYQDNVPSPDAFAGDVEPCPNDGLAKKISLAEDPKISIIIPVFNQWDYTRRCVNSIIHTIPNHSEYEVILADDGSSDETVNAATYFPFLVITRPEENVGFLLNCNHAVKRARGEYIVFLNNDTVVHENWLQELVCIFESDPDVGLVGSKLLYHDNKLQEAGGIIWQDGSGWNYGRGDDPGKPEYNYVREVDYVSGASIMLRASVWKEVGGFDERYIPAYYEDTDLAFAVRNAGYKVVYTPFSMVTHFEGQSHGTDESAGIKKYQSLNKDKFTEKWHAVLSEKHFPNGEHLLRAKESNPSGKTLLVIDHYVPQYDKDAGSRSTFQYLQWFVRKGLVVKFIGDNYYKHEPYTTELQRLGIDVLYGAWYANNWQEWLKENGEDIDYAYLHRPHIAPKYIDAIREFTKAKIIFFGHDLHYLRIQRQYEVERDKRLEKEAAEWKDKEYAIFDKVDVVYYPSYVEVEEIKRHNPDCQVKAIPLNIVDTLEEVRPLDKSRRDLIFVGGFNHKPNVDAINWFVDEIFPIVLQENKDIKLIVVGSNMPKQVRKLASDNIIIRGEVNDAELEALYNIARMSVVPLRYGAGIKGKVLEALRLQLPVVTTSIGAEGLEDANGYLGIAESPEAFAEKIINIYNDDELWIRQVSNGVAALNRYFSDERVSEILGQDIKIS